ncbi:spore maturation protein [bacterium]|nr:spore maturation protein [bacterium]
MLNALWFGFFAVAFMAAVASALFNGDVTVFDRLVVSVFDMARLSAEIALGLVGLLAFWCGLLKIAERSGIASGLGRLLGPLFTRLMPEVPKNHPALGLITLNMASNILGLDNAATPVGIKAMQSLQTLNKDPETASNAQILFLVLNTSSVTLFPVTIIMYRAELGAVAPTDIFLPILLATSASTLVGLIAVALVQRIRLWQPVLLAYFASAFALLAAILYALWALPPERLTQVSSTVGNGLLFTTIVAIISVAFWRKIKVYDEFIDGAKEGFQLAVTIIPYLVAMLVAIGVLRASNVLQAVTDGLAWLVSKAGLDTAFIEALPTAIMKPFSGSGARAMMLETMDTHGVDAFVSKVAAVMQGSTETTFYVLTVYFGAVGIKRVRHAIGCGLVADVAGIVAAVVVSYWFFVP